MVCVINIQFSYRILITHSLSRSEKKIKILLLCSQLWFIAYYHIDDWIWAWHAHIRRLLFLYTCHHHHYYMSSSSSWFFFSRDIIMCVNFYFHGPRRLCVGILLSSAYLLDILLHFSLYCVYISTLCRVSLFFRR